ncbi:MAG: tyrosine-protein phosphatase [Clostridia bacterium]|nr:tyrosine-protein phosphatase [Clostridia bacterium]
MKRTRISVLLVLAFILSLFFTFSAIADSAPSITSSGVSLRIPEEGIKGGLRFKMTVEKPLPEGVEITEQGTIIAPLYVIGNQSGSGKTAWKADLTLDSEKILKVVKTENRYYEYENSFYSYTAVLTDIPVFNYKTPMVARGYVTYTVDGADARTVYSDAIIYDVYSLAKKVNTSAVEEYITDFDAYLSKEDDADSLITITAPAENEVVYPYISAAKNYLEFLENYTGDAETGKEVGDLDSSGTAHYYLVQSNWSRQFYKAIDIKWTSSYENVRSFTVVYATKPDFSDAKYAYAEAGATSVSLYNLFKGTTYYVKVIANITDGTSHSAISTFKTTDLGPRPIKIDGGYNGRDIGGYETPEGTTLQGLIYRGGQLNGTYNYGSTTINVDITDYGKYTAKNELGIKLDIDLRSETEDSVMGITESPIPGARLEFMPTGAYSLPTASESYKKIFKAFSNINNYPIYFHCQGGADRTGTLAYLLNALLGVDEMDLRRDYEFTTFSLYGWRAIDHTSYFAKKDNALLTALNSYEGDTLSAKVETWLTTKIGITDEEIANIKSIMLTGAPKTENVTFPTEVKYSEVYSLDIISTKLLSELRAVYVGGKEVPYEISGGTVSVAIKDFPESVIDGEVTAKLVFEDEEFEGTFTYDSTRTITAPELVSAAFDSEVKVTVNAVVSDVTALYFNDIKVDFTSGDTYVTVTSIPASLASGTVTVKAVLQDGTELTDTFTYDSTRTITAPELVSAAFDSEVKVTVNAVVSDVTALYFNDIKVDFTSGDTYVTVTSIPASLASGTVTVKAVLQDGTELTDTFIYDSSTEVTDVADYLNYNGETTITLDADNTKVSSSAIGYGKWVKIHMEAVNATNGDIRVAYGSYGTILRSNETRYARLSASGTSIGEYKRNLGHSQIQKSDFDTGDPYDYYIRVDLASSTEALVSTKKINRTTSTVAGQHSYVITRLTSDEITSENAGITFQIGNVSTDGTSSLTIYGGKAVPASATFPATLSQSLDKSLEITATGEVTAVYLGDTSVPFTATDTGVSVALSDIPESLASGTVAGKVVFESGEEIEGTFEYDATPLVMIADILDFGDSDTITLNATLGNTVQSTQSVGYGKWIRMHMVAVNGSSGDIKVFVGSYGVQLRGGATRYYTLNTSGTASEKARPSGQTGISQGHYVASQPWYFDIKVDLINDTQATVTVRRVVRETLGLVAEQSYTVTRLTSGEYGEPNAPLTIKIGTSDTTSLVLYKD